MPTKMCLISYCQIIWISTMLFKVKSFNIITKPCSMAFRDQIENYISSWKYIFICFLLMLCTLAKIAGVFPPPLVGELSGRGCSPLVPLKA